MDQIELLVTVKAYPNISKRYGEVVCVAGIRTDVEPVRWVRLYPIHFRDLEFGFENIVARDCLMAEHIRAEAEGLDLVTITVDGSDSARHRGYAGRRAVRLDKV